MMTVETIPSDIKIRSKRYVAAYVGLNFFHKLIQQKTSCQL